MQLIRVSNAHYRTTIGCLKYWQIEGSIDREQFDRIYNNKEVMKKKVLIVADLTSPISKRAVGTGVIVGTGRIQHQTWTEYKISVRGCYRPLFI